MFKLESYVTPLLMGYIDKYVKLKPDDLQVSLWGGDIVLNKLDLRLDAIEEAIKLPIMFRSGHIHELRIHVPWTRLASEPVVITINTIECVLKLRDTTHKEHPKTNPDTVAKPQQKPKLKKPNGDDLPPGYLQSMINRIVNNLKVVVNNLILKFVEDDIVLSLNIKSAECYSADKTWKASFIELAPPQLILRKVIDFHDLTVCLDKRDGSGKIENYQDPSLYRCSMTCRMHMRYDSLHAKLPSVTKMNLFCEKLDVSLTDTQLPMFWRLVELFLAIYYGTLELPDPDPEDADTEEENRDSAIESQTEVPSVPHTSHEGDQASWAGWAWSFVPQVLPTVEGSEEEDSTPRKKTPPILAVGIYCSHASLVVKQTEHVQESRFYGPQKIVFKPFMCFEVHGVGIDVLLEGLEFLNGQFGIISGRIYSVGDCVCGAREDDSPPKSAVFFQSGPQDVALKDYNFMSDSLFDDQSAENLGKKAEFIFDPEVHKEVYTEAWASKKYGAFYLDYMYTMEERGEQLMSGSTSSLLEGDESVRENSTMSFLIGGSHLALSSAMLHRVARFVYSSLDHEYEPYTKVHEEIVDENRPLPTEDQVDAMERHINTRTMHLTLVNTTISILAADHPHCDIKNHKNIIMKKSRRDSKAGTEKTRYIQPLPAVLLQANRFEMQLVRPMYPRRLVKFVSKLKDPSSNLLHHCHTHLYIKIFGVQAGLYRMEQPQPSLVCVVPQVSGAYYKKTLVLPMYWKDPDQPRQEYLYELPNFKLQSTNAQLLLLAYILRSWKQSVPNPERILELSLLEDVFRPKTTTGPGNLPVLVASMTGLDLRQSYKKFGGQIDGTLTSFNLAIHKQVEKKEVVVSLLQGPAQTKGSQFPEFFTTMAADPSSKHKQTGVDVITVCTHLPKELQNEEVPSIIVLDVQGIVANLDPMLYEWLTYYPQQLATPRPLVAEPVAVPEEGALEKHGSKGSQRTGSNATIPTDSQSRTQSRSIQPKPKSAKKAPPMEEVALSLGEQLAAMMPIIRKLNLQVEFHHCCCVFPVTSLTLAAPTTSNIATIHSLFTNHVHFELLVVCLPHLMLHSAGHKAISPGQELPLSNPEMLSTGDKLPWTLKMDDMSVYSFHPDSQSLTLLKPLSLTCTLGITRKYSAKDHKVLKSLGFCIHVDMESMLLGFSNQQVNLIYKLVQKAAETSKTVIKNVQQFNRKIFPKALKKSIDKKEVVPEETSPSKPTQPPTESSQLLESSDPQDTATEDQSTKSIRPIGEILTEVPTSSAMQLSLWIQWTLPKFLLRLFRTAPNGNELCISTDLEDLTTSIDVQEIYCKVKSKVGALNISHYEKKNGSWVPGQHAGVVISTSGKLSKNITILNNKSWTSLNQPIVNLYNIQDFKPRDSSHGFLNLTFTRALRKNVQKKMNTLKMTNSDDDVLSDLGDESDILVNTYVDEICLNTQSFDAVAHVPIALYLVEIFAVHDGIEKVPTDKPVAPPMKTVEKLPWFQSDTLPLFYLNMANIRIFVPLDGKSDTGLASGFPRGEGNKEPGLASETSMDEIEDVMQRKSSDSTIHHDMYVLQVLSVCLTPQPENPLPRSPVNNELYRKLLQAGLSQNPGSEVEDRQYQLDLCGLGLCTGTWAEVDTGSVQCLKLEDEEVIGVQNPALEWNNLITNTTEEDVHLVPIATSVDLRIVAAPALVYKTRNNDCAPALVCGYSLEVNAISDIDFTLSTNQVKLLIQIAQSNIKFFSNKATSTNQSEFSFQTDQSESSYIEVSERSSRSAEVNPNDSGVGSEASTLKTHAAKPNLGGNVSGVATAIEKKLVVRQTSLWEQDLNAKKLDASPSVSDRDVTLLPHIMNITKETLTIHPRRQPKHPRSVQKAPSREENPNKLSYTPFDVLLTAGKITLVAYSHSVVNKADLEKTPQSVKVEPQRQKSKGDLEWREETPLRNLTLSDEFSDASFIGSDLSVVTLLPSVPYAHLPNTRYAGNQSDSDQSCGDSDYVHQTIPFLFANFSQPHSLVNIKPNAQKVELSCYDFTLKGPKANHVITDDLKVLPDFADFPIPWLETRPGDANPKTGIPPSLYTFRITDFLQTPADISLSLERPLKFSVSISKLEQVGEFMERLLPLEVGEHASGETLKDTKPSSGTSRRKLMKIARKHLGQINNLQLKTVQVVVVMETVSHDANAHVTIAASGIHGDVDITNDSGQASAIVGHLLVDDIQCLTSYQKKTRPFIGPLTVSSTASATWCEHSGPSWVPRIIGCVDFGAFDVVFGQEHFMTFDLLRQHVDEYLKKLSASSRQPEKPSRPRTKKTPQGGPSFKVSKHSVDDLRRGAFQYIMEEVESTMRPNPNEVIFCSDDDGQCTMTWCYPEPRMLTMFQVTPVPFNIEADDNASFAGDESLKVGCILQYWDAAQRDFVDWVEFYLSEQEHSEVSLPDIDTPSKVRVAQIWRVSMDAHREKSDDLSCDLEDDEQTPEPLVLPATLAASLRVDSAVVTDLIPGVQFNLSMDLIRLRLEHHLQHFGKGTPSKVRPFFLADKHPVDQEYTRITLDDVHISLSHCHNQMTNVLGLLTAECSLLEYRHLTMRPVFESCSAKWEMLIKHTEKQTQNIDFGCNINPIFLYVSQGALHTLNCALQVWNQLGKTGCDAPLMSYYLFCNDTQESVKFGQVGTDECLSMQCREAQQYSWRSQKTKPLIRLSLDGTGWLWSEPIRIDEVGVNVRSVECRGKKATLTIKITQLTGTIKQVSIRGQLLLSNRLNQHLEVKVVANTPDNHRMNILGARQTIASYVTEDSDMKAIRVKVMGSRTPWTHEIPVIGDKMKKSRLVKIATSDKGTDLYAWCHIFCQHLLGDATRLVVFSPVYVMRSHLPHPVLVNIATPETKSNTQLQVAGRCKEEQLTTLQADVKHHVTFQIRPDSSPSHPPVSLSLSLLDQVKSAAPERPDIDALAYSWDSEQTETWFGYEEPSESSREEMTSTTSDLSSLDRDLDQADLDLQVKFHQQWPGCNTIAMELVPWCLIRNRSALNLTILEDGGKEWALKKDATWAPPKFLGTMKVGISDGSKTWFSSPISFSDKDTQSSQYLPHIEGVLYKDAHTYATVVLDGENNQHRVCYLVLKSTIQDSIQCVTISEKFLMTNLTKIPLEVSAMAVPLNKKTPISSIQTNPILLKEHKEKILQPLTYLSMPETAAPDELLDDMAKYIQVKHMDNISDHEILESFSEFGIHESDLLWSTPARLKPNVSGVRVTLSVPSISAGCYTTKSYVLVLHEQDGVVYMVLNTDDSPALMIHNLTDTPLFYGQTQVNLSIRGVSIFEDSEPLESLPLLPPGGSVFYTFPWQSEQYPQLDKQSYTPKLHLSGVAVNDGGTAVWSIGIDFASSHDNIVNVPNTLDVKVHVDQQCFTKHVFLEEVGRAEVSAKEIRNRIIGHEMVVVMDTSGEKKETAEETTLHSDVDNVLFKPLADGIQGINQDVVISSTPPDQMVARTPVKFKHYKYSRAKSWKLVAHALFKHVCVIMLDDTGTERTSEVLRVVLDNLFILGQPCGATGTKPSPHDLCVICCVSRAQVDNQIYQCRLYDFPVILQPQEVQKENDEFQLDFEEVLDFLDEIEKRSFVWMKFQIDHGLPGHGSQVVTAELAVRPVSLFIEDNYIYDMLKRIDAFIPTSLNTRDSWKGTNVLPKSVDFATQCLLRPIRLEQLEIHPIILCLSVHASLKLFLASENTPLKFGKFEKQTLFTSSQRLTRALAMHYASAALFRAGLVVGSLEILGNPTGLVRNIGSGVADLFRMPLEGLTKGPGSFLSGITHGFSSLLWHTSTGALTSVTNFASSVSRNMDRLSMDSDHSQRQEETRRHRPDRLATGIKQGLTGFGISLLGAIAGLADQPLQSIQQTSDQDRPSSSTQKAAGFISGVGKGLIGVVTKPVGGAAEFVSQTGQGLLHGVGMAKLSKTVYPSVTLPADTAVNSTLKFLWKILQNIPSTDILCILEATTMSSAGPVSEVYLVLTPETVFLINVAEDMAIQAFAVPEMECRRRSSAPDTLLVHLLNKKDDQQAEKNESAKERVAEFIGGETDSDAQVSDIQSETSTDMTHLSVARHEFRTDPNILEIFLAQLHLTKRQLLMKGFPL